jgi:predicted  nucleic acid-binding Zn-ribbon protein
MKVFDDCNVKSEKFQDSMFEEIGNLNTIDAQQRRAERDVQKQKHRLVEIEKEAEDFIPMDEIETALGEAQVEVRSIKKKIDDIRRKNGSLEDKVEQEEGKKKEAQDRQVLSFSMF